MNSHPRLHDELEKDRQRDRARRIGIKESDMRAHIPLHHNLTYVNIPKRCGHSHMSGRKSEPKLWLPLMYDFVNENDRDDDTFTLASMGDALKEVASHM